LPDDRLSINLTHSSGAITRLGPDETDAANIPQDLSFSTSIPGGFRDCSLGLLRRIDIDWPDLGLFDNVRVVGPGGRVAWEGRQAQFPRSHGDSYSITPGAVGWSTSLRDDPSFAEVFIGRDLSQWQPPSLDRRIAVSTAGVAHGQAGTVDGGYMLSFDGEWTTASGFSAEMYYRAPPGRAIKRVGADWTAVNTDATFTLSGYSTQDQVTFPEASADVLTGPAAGTLNFTASTGRQYMGLQFAYPTAAGLAGVTYAVFLEHPYVVGDHGITIQGVTAATAGVLGSDVIAYTVSQAAPLLTYTTGAGGSIEPTSFVIPHLVYRDPTTADQVVTDVNKYHLYDWGVWENREFFYRRPDPDRLCWEARLGDGAHMDADGLTGEQVINGVMVTYTDANGVQRTVGPPSGTAGGFDDTSPDLQDTSEANPANAAGIPAKPDNLTVPFPTNLAGAIQMGTVYLAERSLATRRGSLRLTGTVQHPTEGKVPVWRVRAGDWVRVTDLNGENATVQRKIISTTYTHSSRQIVCELDNTPSKMSAIVERVAIMAGIQQGGGF
jgi:hypothetical protein